MSKIWRVIKRNKDSSLAAPSESRWSLLARACAVESKNEAITVKMASERNLSADDLTDLGLFRQALQQLREGIRDNKEIPSSSRGAEYIFFNNLAAKVGLILSSSSTHASTDAKRASERLRAIVDVRWPDFKKAIEHFKETHPEYTQDET